MPKAGQANHSRNAQCQEEERILPGQHDKVHRRWPSLSIDHAEQQRCVQVEIAQQRREESLRGLQQQLRYVQNQSRAGEEVLSTVRVREKCVSDVWEEYGRRSNGDGGK